MPVNTPNAEYRSRSTEWVKCRDSFRGQDQVKSKTEKYLKRLPNQDEDEYENFLMRAEFPDYFSRSTNALSSVLMIKPLTIDGPESVKSWAEDVTNTGMDLTVFTKNCAEEIMTTGRVGILVDYSGNTEEMTVAQAEKYGSKPFLTMYQAEAIINWQKKYVDGHGFILSRVVLRELYDYTEHGDVYDIKQAEQYRDIYLNEDGVVQQDLYRYQGIAADGAVASFHSSVQPMANGKNLTEIPFVFMNVRNNESATDKPPLLGLADLSFDYYRISADEKHFLHYLGLPTAVISGMAPDEEGAPSTIGPTTLWMLPNPDAKASFLTLKGDDSVALTNKLSYYDTRAAIIGARALVQEFDSRESGLALSIRSQSELSILSGIARSLTNGITSAMKHVARWIDHKSAESVKVSVSSDFNLKPIDSQTIIAMTQAVQAGVMTPETFVYNIKQGEMLPPNKKVEEEVEELQDETIMDIIGREENDATSNQSKPSPDNDDE